MTEQERAERCSQNGQLTVAFANGVLSLSHSHAVRWAPSVETLIPDLASLLRSLI